METLIKSHSCTEATHAFPDTTGCDTSAEVVYLVPQSTSYPTAGIHSGLPYTSMNQWDFQPIGWPVGLPHAQYYLQVWRWELTSYKDNKEQAAVRRGRCSRVFQRPWEKIRAWGHLKRPTSYNSDPQAASSDILSNISRSASILHQTVFVNPIKHALFNIFALYLSNPHTYLEDCKDVRWKLFANVTLLRMLMSSSCLRNWCEERQCWILS